MKEAPILFSGPMVLAILDGRKTQTRRVGKLQSPDYTELGVDYSRHATNGLEAVATYRAFPDGGTARWGICVCPFGVPGDHLWVRETWKPTGLLAFEKPRDTKACGRFAYAADDSQASRDKNIPWRPSIHMPRWASRITLEITGVRVERLQDISEEDAKAEGVEAVISKKIHGWTPHVLEFSLLWDSLNGMNTWRQNPWVWAITFKRV